MESKKRLVGVLERSLSVEEIRRARADSHAKRKPRPCGLTIHTSTGCSYGCLYCYIYDMGFSRTPRPYPLTGLQLAYALVVNESFVMGPHGTLLAFGSVTEPFMDVAKRRTMEYLRVTNSLLGNPQQISVKGVLDSSEVEEFVECTKGRIDVLISVTTLDKARVLEPGAPSPHARIDFGAELARAGISVALFVRPILPGVTDSEFAKILGEAERRGIRRVVLGTLRVTETILKRLTASKAVDVDALRSRVPESPRSPRHQVPLRASDLKKKLETEARELGFKVYPAACSSSIDAHSLYCRLCWMGPCGVESGRVDVDDDGVRDAGEVLGARVETSISENLVEVACRGSRRACYRLKLYLETIAKIRARVKMV